ncbi:MAG: peptidase Ste24p [Frankiales bacterium]|nr:peptidase Ste24p [Frankiales bacterium]
MIAYGAAPFVASLLLFAFSPRLAAKLRPRLAVPLLTGLALSIALCTGLVLSAAALLVCLQYGPVAKLGQWSPAALRAGSGLPNAVGLAALAVVTLCLAAAAVRLRRSVRDLRNARLLAREMRPTSGMLVVVDDDVPTAYAVAGATGRIVVSTSMLAALSSAERRVVLAHEAAHLDHHHHLYLHLARLAAAANPLLRPTATAVLTGIERWADEVAADEVGDRELAAQAVARAALARARCRPEPRAMAVADHSVVERVEALLRPTVRRQFGTVALVVLAAAMSWLSAGIITLRVDDIVQVAESLYSRH